MPSIEGVFTSAFVSILKRRPDRILCRNRLKRSNFAVNTKAINNLETMKTVCPSDAFLWHHQRLKVVFRLELCLGLYTLDSFDDCYEIMITAITRGQVHIVSRHQNRHPPETRKLPLQCYFVLLFKNKCVLCEQCWDVPGQGCSRLSLSTNLAFFLTLFKRGGGQTHVQKICCKFCMTLKAFWQHKIAIKRLFKGRNVSIWG